MAVALPKWQCHKVVEAARIAAIEPFRGTDLRLVLDFGEGYLEAVFVSPAWLEKHDAKAGGYYVLYDDGYASWSPAEAFEAGYTRLP
jgi:hypothetical protein